MTDPNDDGGRKRDDDEIDAEAEIDEIEFREALSRKRLDILSWVNGIMCGVVLTLVILAITHALYSWGSCE